MKLLIVDDDIYTREGLAETIPWELYDVEEVMQAENGKEGYGYLVWGGPENTFRADGKYSQLSIISRETNAVITVTAECRNGAALEKAIFDEIFPQLLL